MARLGKPMPFPVADDEANDYRAAFAKERAALAAIVQEHDVVEFDVADNGYALYVIVSYSPPVLRWVPIGDRIPAAYVRGLTARDLRAMTRQRSEQ